MASLARSREKETESREKDAEPDKKKTEVNPPPNTLHIFISWSHMTPWEFPKTKQQLNLEKKIPVHRLGNFPSCNILSIFPPPAPLNFPNKIKYFPSNRPIFLSNSVQFFFYLVVRYLKRRSLHSFHIRSPYFLMKLLIFTCRQLSNVTSVIIYTCNLHK